MSPKPLLYYTPRSPPCRAVLLTAAAIGLELELRDLNMREGEHLTPEFLKLNPQHTVPVMDDNGVVITDSHVICSYLVDKYGTDDTLYPRNAAKRREVDTLLYFDCGHLWSRIRFIVEPVIYFGYDEIANDRVDYIAKSYDGLENYLAVNNAPFLCGQYLTIADLCCIASVSTGMIISPIDAKKFPKLNAWVERMSQLPYYAKNNKEGAIMLDALMKKRLIENKKAKAGLV